MTPARELTRLTQIVACGGARLTFKHVDLAQSDAVIRAAYEAGTRVFDTARAYGTVEDASENEARLARALLGLDDAFVMTKGGHFRTGEASWGVENTPQRLRSDIEGSRQALGRDTLDMYFVHRADQFAKDGDAAGDAFRAVITALAEEKDAGRIARVGLSNATAEQIDVACGIVDIDAVQNRYSLLAGDTDALAVCEARGIAHFAYSPFGGTRSDGFEADFPRAAERARQRGISTARFALRAVLDVSPVMSVITGATRVESVVDSVAAAYLAWDDDDRAALAS